MTENATADPSPTLAWVVTYVDDVAAAIELYTTAFGLEVAFRHPDGDYAEFATGATALALCSRTLASESSTIDVTAPGAPRGNVTLVVQDVPAAFDRAVASGATPVAEPATKPWGQITSYVADADGNLIELATRVATD